MLKMQWVFKRAEFDEVKQQAEFLKAAWKETLKKNFEIIWRFKMKVLIFASAFTNEARQQRLVKNKNKSDLWRY